MSALTEPRTVVSGTRTQLEQEVSLDPLTTVRGSVILILCATSPPSLRRSRRFGSNQPMLRRGGSAENF